MMTGDITLILNYSGQATKLILFLKQFYNIYQNTYNININLVSQSEVSSALSLYIKECVLDIKIVGSLDEAIDECATQYIIFQDLVVLHKSDIIKTLLSDLKEYDLVGISKTIENTKLSDNFKNCIIQNKLPDILACKKEFYSNNSLKFNMEDIQRETNFTLIHSRDIEYLFPQKIPKKVHFYWGGSKMCYSTYLSLKTFVFHNPDWEVNLWMPKIRYTGPLIWEKNEFIPPHTLSYDDIDYLNYDYLENELGINIKNIDYFDLGLSENCNEVLKSDIFRWKTLSEVGGVWSDLDILFVNQIEKTDFEKYGSEFHDLTTVVSQYQMLLPNDHDVINFYYIGLLMSSPNNIFYKIMYELSMKVLDPTSYQGVGGDLMKKHFGLYDNIKNIINHTNYANLDISSVYSYLWINLKDLYTQEVEEDILNFVTTNNNIIGYHWFRGVHLSKLYTLFLNYKKRIQNMDFKGILPQWINYYSHIFNDFSPITKEKKISVVIGYVDRLPQLKVTLSTIQESIHNNVEIIIVNDGDENIDHLEYEFNEIKIKIIDNSNQTTINPCMTYNLGIEHSTGEIIIIQNAECCHVGDILAATNALLKKNDYLVFSSFYLDTYEKNDVLDKILFDNKEDFWSENKMNALLDFTHDYKEGVLPAVHRNWASHPVYNYCPLHFCVAIYKDKLNEIGNFSEKYAHGICFDDDDLVRKAIYQNLNVQYFLIPQYSTSVNQYADHAAFVMHQHHDRFSYSDPNIMKKWHHNKNLFLHSHYEQVQKYLIHNYLNKDILDSGYLVTNNGYIKEYENGFYKLSFETGVNSAFFKSYIKKTMEYVFNGRSMKLENNIIELLNDSEFEVIIDYKGGDEILFYNGDDFIRLFPEENSTIFIYKGKINVNIIKCVNLNVNTTINCKCLLRKLSSKDNTMLSQPLPPQ